MAVGMDARTVSLLRRYQSDASFREAVDDMTLATGLVLPGKPLGGEIDDIVHVARFKRLQARLRQSGTREVLEERGAA